MYFPTSRPELQGLYYLKENKGWPRYDSCEKKKGSTLRRQTRGQTQPREWFYCCCCLVFSCFRKQGRRIASLLFYRHIHKYICRVVLFFLKKKHSARLAWKAKGHLFLVAALANCRICSVSRLEKSIGSRNCLYILEK